MSFDFLRGFEESHKLNRPVESLYGLAAALRDLITKAGDGELVGGQLSGAIADTNGPRLGSDGEYQVVYVTIGTKRFQVTVKDA